ncbi:MAG: PDDEXK nuclease domain-containing protein [Pontiella sp.]
MRNPLKNTGEYRAWLKDLKLRVRQAQVKAAVRVNSDLAQQQLMKDPYTFDFLALTKDDNERAEATIGILLCKSHDRVVAEYALSNVHQPIGVSEYELTRSLPNHLKSSLPSIEEWEAELGDYSEGVE